MALKLTINGAAKTVEVEPEMPLLWFLRDELGLTAAKYGCGIAVCGACTVHVNGKAVRSCVLPLAAVEEGAEVTTLEGLAAQGAHPVQQAWVEHQAPQCGYCQPGMIMAVAALLKDNPNPTEDEVNARITNICRCGTYQAVRAALESLRGRATGAPPAA